MILVTALLSFIAAPVRASEAPGFRVTGGDLEAWHDHDRRHVLTLLARSYETSSLADLFYLEWIDICNVLQLELANGAVLEPSTGIRVYGAVETSRVHILNLAKRARENALVELSERRIPSASTVYPRLLGGGANDGALLDASGLSKVPGAVPVRVDDTIRLLHTLKGIPKGALNGVAVFLSPFVFKSDNAHTFSGNHPGADEWIALSAVSGGSADAGLSRDTIAHEIGHVIHFEYFGAPIKGNPLWDEYASMRGKPVTDDGLWENLTAENFAEDYRSIGIESTLAHRGAYGAMDSATRARFASLIEDAVSRGPSGQVKVASLRVVSSDISINVFIAPSSTNVFITTDSEVNVYGEAHSYVDWLTAGATIRSATGTARRLALPEGQFRLRIPVAAPGIYQLDRAFMTDDGSWGQDYTPPLLTILSLGRRGDRLAEVSSHWARRDIALLLCLGVLAGYPDGRMKPEGSVSRGEFTRMVFSLTGIGQTSTTAPFDDTGKHWAGPYIDALWAFGWLPALKGRQFNPDSPITRDEMARVLYNVAGKGQSPKCDLPDVAPKDRSTMGFLLDKGIITGLPDGLFHGKNLATRAQAMAALARLYDVLLDKQEGAGLPGPR